MIVRAQYWTVQGETAKARASIDAANAMVNSYQLARLRPLIGVVTGELLLLEGKADAAVAVWKETEATSKQLHQKRHMIEAQLGLIQAERRSKPLSQISILLYQLEKEVRAIGSRKIKAKFLAVKAVVTQQANGFLDNRLLSQSLQILSSCNMSVMERQITDLAIQLNLQAGKERDVEEYERDLRQILEKGSADLHLIQSRLDLVGVLPVSLIA
jgi:hypothetical protein